MEPLVLNWPFATITISKDSYKLVSPLLGLDVSVEAPEWPPLPSAFTQTKGS
jgi:hypothetical protein